MSSRVSPASGGRTPTTRSAPLDGRDAGEEVEVDGEGLAPAGPGLDAVQLLLVEKFLPTFTLDELNGIAKLSGQGSRVIAVTGPSKMKTPTAEAMLAIAKNVEARSIAAYEDAVANTPLMASPPKPGRVVEAKAIPELGVTEWKLQNGVRVVVKPTEFDNDEVKMAAFSPGGHSLVKDADFDSARFADSIVGEGGIGPFDVVKLRKLFAGKVVSVRARVSELEEGLSGRASPADLELMFQLIHLGFTAPRRDENAFKSWRAREIESARNRRLSPEGSFYRGHAAPELAEPPAPPADDARDARRRSTSTRRSPSTRTASPTLRTSRSSSSATSSSSA